MKRLEVHSCNNGHDMRKIGASYDETDNTVVIFDGCGAAYAIGYVYVPVKRGHWQQHEGYNGDPFYSCSVCHCDWTTIDGTPHDNNMRYCPECGAKMDEVSQ